MESARPHLRPGGHRRLNMQRKSQTGMTLMELIIVMIIVGILAAVAVPSYRAYVMRSQRADAKDALLAAATAQEKHYLQCNTYGDDLANATDCAAGTINGSDVSKNGWYELTVTASDATSFSISATASVSGNQAADDDCDTFIINERGIRTAENAGGTDNTAECWR